MQKERREKTERETKRKQKIKSKKKKTRKGNLSRLKLIETSWLVIQNEFRSKFDLIQFV